MDSSTTHTQYGTNGAPAGHGGNVSHEFGTWPVEGSALETSNKIRFEFDNLLRFITGAVPKGNERYLAIVKTKLEEGCMFAIKAVAKPTNA